MTNLTISLSTETRQQMFTEGLSTFFSDFVQSSAAAAVVASKAPKSAVKTKKADKRIADVL